MTLPVRAATLAALVLMASCRPSAPPSPGPAAATPPPTNRIDIPLSVRRNLNMTFARVERRNVAQTLRFPGRFEYEPTARREYRAPLSGRVDILVDQFQVVTAGTPLFHLDAAPWRELHEQIASIQARVESMGPLREAHRRHEAGLAAKVQIWRERLRELEALRQAGGGSAAALTEARATLNATEAELADVMEKDAELLATQKQAEAELRALRARREALLRSAACEPTSNADGQSGVLTVCAAAPGVVEYIASTPGALVPEGGHILTLVQPERLRFRARALQSDLASISTGQPATIVPPQGTANSLQSMTGELRIALSADPDARTVDLIVQPSAVPPWAKAGVWAHAEVTRGQATDLAIPLSAIVHDGLTPVIFRRDPANPDQVIRLEADLGVSDGRWVVIASGVKEGDEVVLGGNYQLMLASSATSPRGGHFHPDGTYHEGDH